MHAPSAPVQRIGDVADRRLVAFWIKDQRIRAAMNVNLWDLTDQIQALIRSRLRLNRDRLADPNPPLTGLAPGREAGQGDA